MLKGRDVEFAKRSFRIAAAFGLASACSVIVLGDESGYTVGEAQQTKMAAMEAMWDTEPAPAGLKLVAGIDRGQHAQSTWEVEIPWVMGLIGTRSVSKDIAGHSARSCARNRERIVDAASRPSTRWRRCARTRTTPRSKATFEAHKADLGFGLLLKSYT